MISELITELRQFLNSRGLLLKVWLSEDQTRIAGRIHHHSSTNQIVGFVLSLNDEGLPIVGSSPATSCKKIAEYFESKQVNK